MLNPQVAFYDKAKALATLTLTPATTYYAAAS